MNILKFVDCKNKDEVRDLYEEEVKRIYQELESLKKVRDLFVNSFN